MKAKKMFPLFPLQKKKKKKHEFSLTDLTHTKAFNNFGQKNSDITTKINRHLLKT